MIYKFRHGSTFHGIDPTTAGEELERIRLTNGGKLKPEDVLESARSEESPIHDVFTWDDDKAAETFRMWEARAFIRSVVVVRKSGATPQPAYFNVSVALVETESSKPSSEQFYQSAEVIAHDSKAYDAALTMALRELASAQRGLEQLRQIAPRRTRSKVAQATGHVESAQQVLEHL